MIDSVTCEPIRNVTLSKSIELGFKNTAEVEGNTEKFPILTFADVFNQLFDKISLPSRNDFALYSNILLDIRNARTKKANTIPIDKTDLEKIKKVMEKGIAEQPEFNKKIAFINEIVEETISNIVIKNKT